MEHRPQQGLKIKANSRSTCVPINDGQDIFILHQGTKTGFCLSQHALIKVKACHIP